MRRVVWLVVVVLPMVISAPATEVPQSSGARATYTISEMTPKVFVKTEEFELNSTSCMQYSFSLNAHRVKLRAYECLMGEGGYCVMNKHAYPRNSTSSITGCRSLRPWYRHEKNYAFYFTLEKRERKYGPGKQHLKRKRARKVRENGRYDAKKIGELTLDGIRPCTEVCDYDLMPKPPK